MENLSSYIFPAAVLLFFAWRWVNSRRARKALPGLLRRGAQIIDVRSPAEFEAAHAPGSVNIPLTSLPSGLANFDKTKPVLLCCASGARSGMAVAILRKQGFHEVLNAGAWQNICASQRSE